jgi:hypothetical protein
MTTGVGQQQHVQLLLHVMLLLSLVLPACDECDNSADGIRLECDFPSYDLIHLQKLAARGLGSTSRRARGGAAQPQGSECTHATKSACICILICEAKVQQLNCLQSYVRNMC